MKKLLVIAANLDAFNYFVSCYAPEYGSLIKFYYATCIDGNPHATPQIMDMNGFILFREWPHGVERLIDILHNIHIPEYETVNDFITLNQ